MDDAAYRRFFTEPAQVYHRQYEALRAVFVDRRPQKEVAEEFGFEYGSLRQLIHTFRRSCNEPSESAASPFFETPTAEVSR